MPTAHDADPWVRPPLGGHATSSIYGIRREGPGPQEDFSFADLLDVINPLQHIPIVSSFYRELTGDEIKPTAQILGTTLYGGPAGLVASTSLAIIQQASGGSPMDRMAAHLIGTDKPDSVDDSPAVAAAQMNEEPLVTSEDGQAQPPPSGMQVGRGPQDSEPEGGTPADVAQALEIIVNPSPAPGSAGPQATPPHVEMPLPEAAEGSVTMRDTAGPTVARDETEPPMLVPRAAPLVPVELAPAAGATLAAGSLLPADDKKNAPGRAQEPRADAAAGPAFTSKLLEAYDKYETLLHDRKDKAAVAGKVDKPGI